MSNGLPGKGTSSNGFISFAWGVGAELKGFASLGMGLTGGAESNGLPTGAGTASNGLPGTAWGNCSNGLADGDGGAWLGFPAGN